MKHTHSTLLLLLLLITPPLSAATATEVDTVQILLTERIKSLKAEQKA